jgi:hypothetical protein
MLLVIVAPVVSFFVILNRNVPLVPLVGMEAQCAECNRKATRTLKTVADALLVKSVYVYDRTKYKAPPAWCEQHGPDKTHENTLSAYLGSVVVLAAMIALYKRVVRN